MNPEIENELRRELVRKVEDEVTKDRNPVWGHGTQAAEIAEKILEEGIIVSKNYGIQEMAYPITDNSKTPEENANNIVGRSLTWQHRDSKFLVLISIPETIGRKEELTEDIVVDGQEKRRLPSRFIKGYIDSLNLRFVKNSRYEADAEPTEQEQIPTGLPKRNQGSRKVEIPQPTEGETGNSDDVW